MQASAYEIERDFKMKKQSRSEAREAVFTQVFQFATQRENMDVAREILLTEKPECEQNLGTRARS